MDSSILKGLIIPCDKCPGRISPQLKQTKNHKVQMNRFQDHCDFFHSDIILMTTKPDVYFHFDVYAYSTRKTDFTIDRLIFL